MLKESSFCEEYNECMTKHRFNSFICFLLVITSESELLINEELR